MVVPGAVFAEDEAGNEQSGRPGEQEANAVGTMLYVVLPEVENAGDEEQNCEEDGDAFDRGVEPEGAGDCEVVLGAGSTTVEHVRIPMCPIPVQFECCLHFQVQ